TRVDRLVRPEDARHWTDHHVDHIPVIHERMSLRNELNDLAETIKIVVYAQVLHLKQLSPFPAAADRCIRVADERTETDVPVFEHDLQATSNATIASTVATNCLIRIC